MSDSSSHNSTSSSVRSLVRLSDTVTGSFASLRLVVILSIAAVVITAVACMIVHTMAVDKYTRAVYVVEKGVASVAERSDGSYTRGDEIREVSTRFHRLLFNVSPNAQLIRNNVEEVLTFSDRSVYNFFNDQSEAGFYRRLSETNSYQEVMIDSVVIRPGVYPYPVVTYMTRYVTRSRSITRYDFVTEMNMVETPRSSVNLNGLRVENFRVTRNDEIGTVRR